MRPTRPKAQESLKVSPLARAQALSRIKLGNEADVEMYFVPEFLAMLGYRYPRDIKNAPALDSPEYYVGSRKKTAIYPDHIVYANERMAFVLEVKSPSRKLDESHISQVLSYTLHPDVQADVSVLTNGRTIFVLQTRRREPLLVVEQREIPARLPDLQLLLSRKSWASKVGGVVIEKRLGRGAFGTVYKAWNPSLRRHEAIKIYHPEIVTSEATRRRLSQGLRAQAQLHHPCIAHIYSEQGEGAEVVTSMQYSPGISFDRWIKSKPSALQMVEVLVQVARAVQFAHEQGVIHRDLKPSNVLVEKQRESWKPLIVDFDTAVSVDATWLTKTLDSIGTPGFMAPEMYSVKRARRFSKRNVLVDVYSLGALAFFSFFGPPPRSGTASLRIDPLAKRLKGLNAGQARKLVTTILRAMDMEPEIRYATAALLANDLEESISEAPTLQAKSEEEVIDALFDEVDQLLSEVPLPGIRLKIYDANNQLGRWAKVLDIGEVILMHDFDHRELMTGFTFSRTRQFNAFLNRPALAKLRNAFGSNLIVDPPSPSEDGGIYVLWRLSEIISKGPKALAKEATETLRKFIGCLEEELPGKGARAKG